MQNEYAMQRSINSEFRRDLKRVREAMVYCSVSNAYFKITKREALERSKEHKMAYYITDKIFVQKRKSMVIQ
jgi:hypothetical protein